MINFVFWTKNEAVIMSKQYFNDVTGNGLVLFVFLIFSINLDSFVRILYRISIVSITILVYAKLHTVSEKSQISLNVKN